MWVKKMWVKKGIGESPWVISIWVKTRKYVCESLWLKSLRLISLLVKKCVGESLWVKSIWLNSLG